MRFCNVSSNTFFLLSFTTLTAKKLKKNLHPLTDYRRLPLTVCMINSTNYAVSLFSVVCCFCFFVGVIASLSTFTTVHFCYQSCACEALFCRCFAQTIHTTKHACCCLYRVRGLAKFAVGFFCGVNMIPFPVQTASDAES